ncbi:MAG: hypothetical protein ACXWIT_21245 [Burkholderiales bacterium]
MIPVSVTEARILIVKSDRALCDQVATWLSAYRTVSTTDCGNASALLQEHAFDCYVIGVELVDGSAHSLCAAIRNFDPNGAIVVYSNSRAMAGGDALMAGANVLLQHPEDGPALASTVEGLLQVQHMRMAGAQRAAYQAMRDEVVDKIDAVLTRSSELRDRDAQWGIACKTLIQDNDVRLCACKAFLGSGGTRANFQRAWPELVAGLEAAPACVSACPIPRAAGAPDVTGAYPSESINGRVSRRLHRLSQTTGAPECRRATT